MSKSHVSIQVVQNGYVVTPDFAPSHITISSNGQYVFESFATLSKWLESNLEKPQDERNRELKAVVRANPALEGRSA